MTQNDIPNDPFGWHLIHESNLNHQIFIGGMSSDYLGKFSLWSWCPRQSFSLVPGPIPVSGHEKSMFAKSIKDDLYDAWESLGMLWGNLEHFWGHLE